MPNSNVSQLDFGDWLFEDGFLDLRGVTGQEGDPFGLYDIEVAHWNKFI